ncbi:MAG TPA: ABC transporter substrate-binding protein [Clostridia bacterium]|nr:ABC transporter substrate-binding protein [Clostridia bacterium]
MNRRTLSSILLIVLFATLAAGCSDTGAVPRRGDSTSTLYIGEAVSAFPTSFLPWQSRDGVDPTIASLLYDTLSPYDEETGEYGPGLAKEWYFVDENDRPIVLPNGGIDYDKLEQVYGGDDTTYMTVKFILHDNITWSDGEPLTAEDVYFTFDLAANYALSQHAGALVWVNDVQHTYSNGKLTGQGIFTYDHGAKEAGYDIPASQRDTVVYFRVNKVLGSVATLTSTVLILPKHIIEPLISPEHPLINRTPTDAQIAAYANPVGSGPYALDAANSNSQQLALVRRDDYYLKDDGGGMLYKPEKLIFLLYQDINVALYALKKGHIDILDAPISANYANLFGDDGNIEVMRAPALFVDTLVLNMNAPEDMATPERALLSNADFRRAIALCIDQQELIGKVLNGTGQPYSQGLVGREQPFYNPASFIVEQGGTAEEIAQANALLDSFCPERDEDGYRLYEGRKITFEILGTPGEQSLISYLQVQFQRIGIDVVFKAKGSNPENTYLYSGDFDMTIQKVTLSETNIDVMAEAHFVNLSKSSNYGRHIDEDFTALVESMRATLNRNEKYRLAEQMQLAVANMFYKIPLYSADVLSVYRTDRFANYQISAGQTALNAETLRSLVHRH